MRRLLFANSPKHAPKRQLTIAGMIGPVAVWFVSPPHTLIGALGVALLFAGPSALVEAWWKARHRRREEQLLPRPEHQACSAFGTSAGPVDRDGS